PKNPPINPMELWKIDLADPAFVSRWTFEYYSPPMLKLDLRSLARIGAEARIRELEAGIAEIRRAFLRDDTQRRGPVKRQQKQHVRKKPAWSAAARKAVSERMKKYWAERRKKAKRK